jgi:hypothetical protein
MELRRGLTWTVLCCYLLTSGCTVMREIPRTELAAQPERKGVRVMTRDSLLYTFEYATFDGDSLTGYHDRADLEGIVGEVAVHRIALDDVQRLTTRKVDWYRTSLVGGSIVVAAIAAGLAATAIKNNNSSAPTDPCPRGCGGLPALRSGH